jgi:hypothetical protein
MRIRFNDRVDPFYGYCFCCSSLFQLQMLKHMRGAAVLHFFPSQVSDFWIVCPPVPRQKMLANRIRARLAALEARKAKILQIREKIDTVVLSALAK